MYGYELEIEHNMCRAAPPLCSSQSTLVRSRECDVVKNKKGEESRTQRDWLTVTEASDRAAVSAQTIKNWINWYGIGIKVAGRYRVLPAKLDAILRGEAVKR
jgi:hypothetical protein